MRGSAVTVSTKAIVRKRAKDLCERCGRSLGRDYSYHHRRPRGMGGTNAALSNDAANIVLLCGTGTTMCHGEVESHRRLALDQGWLVSQYEPNPASVPILMRGEWRRLDRDGCVTAA